MNNSTEIEKLIEAELEYFKPMEERSLKSTKQERSQWKIETIRQRQERISLEVYHLLDQTVRYGPFKGIKLDSKAWWGKLDLGSQCLGLYEKELLNFIDGIKKNSFNTLIDIGAADGYYAIGMLASKKVTHAICFEKSEEGRETIKRNWINNGSPGTLQILGEASVKSISEIPIIHRNNSLIIIDIEGGEFELITIEFLQLLSTSTILLEIHNWINEFNIQYSNLLRRIAEHHNIFKINRVERSTLNIPELRDFTDDNRLLLTSERRPCLMRFLHISPKPQT